jgi:hypothetical protein
MTRELAVLYKSLLIIIGYSECVIYNRSACLASKERYLDSIQMDTFIEMKVHVLGLSIDEIVLMKLVKMMHVEFKHFTWLLVDATKINISQIIDVIQNNIF